MSPPLRLLLSAFALLCGLVSAQPVVTFVEARYNYGENGLPVSERITIARDIADGDSTVTVTTVGNGTATSGVDYNALALPVTFKGDELVKTIEIPITQDTIVELDETFDLTLEPVSNATIGASATTTVTILNDDQATISINDVSKAEGTGNGMTQYAFSVTMSNPVDVPVTFAPKISVSDPTEILTYITNPIGPGSPSIHTIYVMVQKDSTVELDEQFLVTLEKIEASGRNVTFADNVGAGTILNDDQSVIGLSCVDVIEGDSGTPKMVFTVTMDNEVDVPVTVAMTASTGGATTGVDFRRRSDRVAVTTSGTPFEVDIIPDNLAENKEYIMCTLQKRFLEASGRNVILRYNVNGFIFTYGILNDDFAPVANDDGAYEVVEDGNLTITANTGILANDTDQDDGNGPANLTAVVKSGPTRGTLILKPDGGFSYTPTRNFFGSDSFTYAASDGTNESPAATVQINIIEQIDIAVGVDLLQNPLVAGGDTLDVFRVTVTNRGPSNATDVRLSQKERFPAFVTVTSAAASAGIYDRGLWRLDLAENATATLILTIQAGADTPSGTGVLPFGFSFGAARQPEINPSNNTAAASVSIINAADTGTAITVAPAVDLQSGLFVGKVTVTNQNSEPVPAFRLYVHNLPKDVRVYNAHGIRSFGPHFSVLPYLLHNSPLASGASVTLSIEFFRPSLDPNFTPQYEIELLSVPETMPAAATGGIPVTRNQRLSNGDHLIEIATIPGAVYAVEYSHDMAAWTRVVPSVTAPANRLQWIDNGPPKTSSHPTTAASRYYRFVLVSDPVPSPSAP